MKYIFVGVNYGTSDLIQKWHASIVSQTAMYEIYLVDNYSTTEERSAVIKICEELNIELITLHNVGYGRALNESFEILKDRYHVGESFCVLAGNIDIRFIALPKKLPVGNYIFVPSAMEGRRNRNPFLTVGQKRFLFLHKLTLRTNSTFVMLGVVSVLKLVGFFPSRTWAVHGSLFCFNISVLRHGVIFNENTFLYSEELEFGSYVELISRSKYLDSDIKYEHIPHAATSKIISSKTDFINIWKPGFNNWLERWSRYERD
jgi:glycosyltransferase involved in cell wall biosynthesis